MKHYTLKTAGLVAAAALALTACGGGGGGGSEPAADGAATADPNEEVTLTFTWWGNDDRAARMAQAIDLFEEENPSITVQGNFSSFNDYWTARNT